MIIGLILFALVGFGCGFAVRGPAAWLALLVPIAFFLLTAFLTGLDSDLLVTLAIALGVTAVSLLAGRLLDAFLERRGVEV